MLGSALASISVKSIKSPGFRTPEIPAPSVTSESNEEMTGVFASIVSVTSEPPAAALTFPFASAAKTPVI